MSISLKSETFHHSGVVNKHYYYCTHPVIYGDAPRIKVVAFVAVPFPTTA